MIKFVKKRIIYILIFLIFLIIYLLPKKELAQSENSSYIKNPHEKINANSLRIGIEKLDNPLNPLFDGGNTVSLISKLLHSSIFTRDKNNEVNTDLASEYWYEDGGKTIAIVLKKQKKFEDGKEITTDSILNTYKVLADPSYGGQYASFVNKIEGYYEYKSGLTSNFQGIEVLGKYFIKFKFTNADFSNIKNLTFPILDIDSKDFEYGDIENIREKVFINSSSYYNVIDYNNEKVSLVKKENNETKNIKVDKIDIYLSNFYDVYNKYKRGDLDIIYEFKNSSFIQESNKNRIEEYSYSIKHESSMYSFLGFNIENSVLKDENLRIAIKNELDIKSIINKNVGEDIYNFPEIPVYKNSWFNNRINGNEESLNIKSELSRLNMGNITLDLIVQEDNELFNAIEKDFIKAFENKGLNINIKRLSSDKMYRALSEKKGYDLYISQHFMREVPENFEYLISGSQIANGDLSRELSNRFLYLLEKLKSNVNSKEIQDLADLWRDNFNKTTPYIVIANENIITIVNKKIRNLYINEFVGLDDIHNLEQIHY